MALASSIVPKRVPSVSIATYLSEWMVQATVRWSQLIES